jgi:hypothetical protein
MPVTCIEATEGTGGDRVADPSGWQGCHKWGKEAMVHVVMSAALLRCYTTLIGAATIAVTPCWQTEVVSCSF